MLYTYSCSRTEDRDIICPKHPSDQQATSPHPADKEWHNGQQKPPHLECQPDMQPPLDPRAQLPPLGTRAGAVDETAQSGPRLALDVLPAAFHEQPARRSEKMHKNRRETASIPYASPTEPQVATEIAALVVG